MPWAIWTRSTATDDRRQRLGRLTTYRSGPREVAWKINLGGDSEQAVAIVVGIGARADEQQN
jgi:hypothetical protein